MILDHNQKKVHIGDVIPGGARIVGLRYCDDTITVEMDETFYCEWRFNKETGKYNPACDPGYLMESYAAGFTYCPKCSAPIKVVVPVEILSLGGKLPTIHGGMVFDRWELEWISKEDRAGTKIINNQYRIIRDTKQECIDAWNELVPLIEKTEE